MDGGETARRGAADSKRRGTIEAKYFARLKSPFFLSSTTASQLTHTNTQGPIDIGSTTPFKFCSNRYIYRRKQKRKGEI